tara:strand:- start:1704 stop:1970 length:267 start_codon:yes stop_codon:yes gene_type:complete
MSYFKLFNEKIEKVSSIKVLANNFIDRGAHPNKFENGNFKNELSEVYNKRKILQIKELSSKKKVNNLATLSTKKLDKIYLQLSNKSKQ